MYGAQYGDMIIEDSGADYQSSSRKADLAKGTVAGAVAALKTELQNDVVMKRALWRAIMLDSLIMQTETVLNKRSSKDIGLVELRFLLDICAVLYEPKTSHLITLRRPKHLRCNNLGKVGLEPGRYGSFTDS